MLDSLLTQRGVKPRPFSYGTVGQSLQRSATLAGNPLRERKVAQPGKCKGRRGPPAVLAAATVEAPPNDLTMSEVVQWGEQQDKRLQVQVLPIARNTVAIRCLDWDRDRFDIEFGLQNGTTYNSYVIFGEKVALVDASHEKFRDLYLRTLKEVLGGRDIDYMVVSHTEPDHSGLIPDILNMYPDITVAGSKVSISFLENLALRKFKSQAVKGGQRISLGSNPEDGPDDPPHELEFVMAPNLHWPDTMFSFDHATGVMYTCDAFGMHYCEVEPYDAELTPIEPHYRFYYDCLMRPNAKSVTTALRKVKDLDYTTIAVGHGPILRYNIPQLVGKYKTWSESVGKATASVAVFYAGNYGFSDRLSQTLARGITKAGVATEMVDLLSADAQELVEVMGRNSGVVLMAPPSESPEAQSILSTFMSAVKPKQKVLVAESYGGQDEPVDTIISNLVGVGVEPLGGVALRVKDTPTEGTYQAFEEAGTDLAQALTQKDQIARKKAAMAPEIARALARISSGLYVVTAANRSARSAMIASWVAQASFEPLGLTIAVAKDRAIESLMQVGDEFVLNCLGESSYSEVMKHFLKRFPAGADRFEGVNWFPAKNGSPVLEDSIAYMECKVVSRMETSDHWITYCEVKEGGVFNPDVKTAVHRRKVANYY